MNINKKIQIRVGNNPLVLQPSEYMASGGEAVIYRKGPLVYKLYTTDDPSKKSNLEEKAKLLQQVTHPNIISPKDIVYKDGTHEILGYSMPYISGEVLVRYFSNEFRSKATFGNVETTKAVHQMKEIVETAHSNHALIVDGNEMNYIIDVHNNPYIIDVDSWQIGKFHATAIMPSVRDYRTQGFTNLTDWFTWAIVTFQLFVGIHPYKGKHPAYKMSDMQRRMENNISIFNKDVTTPASMRSLDEIPKALKDWYYAVFEKGERLLPPDKFDASLVPLSHKTMVQTIQSAGKLKIVKIADFESDILEVYPDGSVVTQNKVYVTGKEIRDRSPVFNTQVIPFLDGWVETLESIIPKKALIYYINNKGQRQQVSLQVNTDKFLVVKDRTAGRIFSINGNGLTELGLLNTGTSYIAAAKNTWAIESNSSFIGDGVVIYDALGTPFVVLPIGKNGCTIVRCPELANCTVIHAKAISNFVTCLVKDRRGQNFKVELLFDASSGNIVSTWKGETDENELNFAVNEKGVVATIVEDGKLVLFIPLTQKKMVIEDRHIKTDMKLWSYKSGIAFSLHNQLWSISMT